MSDQSIQKDVYPIRFACMSLMWGWCVLPNDRLEIWMQEVREAGYDGIACFDGELLRFASEMPLRDLLRDNALQLASVDYFIDRDFDRLKRVCETMQAYGCRHLVTLAGLAAKGADMKEIADVLNQIGEIALKYDVMACYHNHTDNTGETMEETETLVGLTDPAKFFGFLDVGHATKDFAGHSRGERAALFLERNWDRIRFIEFKDWCEQSDLSTEVGAGETDYARVFEVLKRRGYKGWITVEQNGPTQGKTPFESAKGSRDFIRKAAGW